MPTISLFYGIIIRMFWRDIDKHKMPHVHAYYGEFEAVFTFDGEILSGEFPNKQAALVKAWALLHEDDLNANWKLALNGEETYRIEPLR
ncbi:MAG: DUF4160 domain-containing protein [Synergistaceae bacterium]|nr:DUF4160 domain-containing protein [Synergistaceae bacterium]MBR1604340.1 DUF4160 domain-containing protein [Synergistaceae bacterium]